MRDALVEVVVVNFRRPRNIAPIVAAFREQSVPCLVTLLDTAEEKAFAVPKSVRERADRCFRWRMNFGPFSRYVPMGAFGQPFTYFHDDDALPGRRLLEHYLDASERIGAFGALGQWGQNVAPDGDTTVPDGEGRRVNFILREDRFVPVDILLRGYFVPTRHLPAVLRMKDRMGVAADVDLEDDVLLCAAMQVELGLDCYLTPAVHDRTTLMNADELDPSHAHHHRPGFLNARASFCRAAIRHGWRPLAVRGA